MPENDGTFSSMILGPKSNSIGSNCLRQQNNYSRPLPDLSAFTPEMWHQFVFGVLLWAVLNLGAPTDAGDEHESGCLKSSKGQKSGLSCTLINTTHCVCGVIDDIPDSDNVVLGNGTEGGGNGSARQGLIRPVPLTLFWDHSATQRVYGLIDSDRSNNITNITCRVNSSQSEDNRKASPIVKYMERTAGKGTRAFFLKYTCSEVVNMANFTNTTPFSVNVLIQKEPVILFSFTLDVSVYEGVNGKEMVRCIVPGKPANNCRLELPTCRELNSSSPSAPDNINSLETAPHPNTHEHMIEVPDLMPSTNYTLNLTPWFCFNNNTFSTGPTHRQDFTTTPLESVEQISSRNTTSVSVEITFEKNKRNESFDYEVGYYYINNTNDHNFDCVVTKRIESPKCSKTGKLERCRDIPSSAVANSSLETITVGDLWPARVFSLSLTPFFCIKNRTIEGEMFPLDPFNTSSAEIKWRNVTSTDRNNVTVEWSTDAAHPNVTYTVYVTDVISAGASDISTCSSHQVEKGTVLCLLVSNETRNSCSGNVSLAFWEYNVSIIATSRRANFSSTPTILVTKPTPPGQVDSLNYTLPKDRSDLLCDGKSMKNHSLACITWSDMCSRDRNSFVRNYLISVTVDGGDIYKKTLASGLSIANVSLYRRNQTRHKYTHLVNVKPNTTNTVKVQAVTMAGEAGLSASREFTVQVPEPNVTISQTQVEDLVPKSDIVPKKSSLQFTVTNTTLLFQDGSGFDLTPLFVVTTDSLLLLSQGVTPGKKYPNWSQRNIKNGQQMYLVPLNVSKTDGRIQLEIGSDDSCPTNNTGYYCNGPLDAGKSYSVVGVLCNEQKCVGVILVKDAFIPSEQKGLPSWVTSLVSGAVVVTTLLLIAVAYGITRRRRMAVRELSDWTEMNTLKEPRSTRPMKLASLENVIARKQRDEGLLLRDEFDELVASTNQSLPHVTFNLEINRCKNRWADIVTYDHTRVKINPEKDGSDYINANFIPGYNRPDEFIATQGPLACTMNDFWKMVWEHKVPVIVMLTLTKEGGKIKCEQYWPVQLNDMVEYGDIRVTNISFSNVNDYNITIFTLKHSKQDKGKELRVSHFQFLKWPDMTADVTPESIVEFITLVRKHVLPRTLNPVVVHCSAGVGRTGTFICLDYVMQFIYEKNLSAELDIYGFIMRMRKARIMMVQTETQYILIHQCARYLMTEKRLKETESGSNGQTQRSSNSRSISWQVTEAKGQKLFEAPNGTFDYVQLSQDPTDNDTEELDTTQRSDLVEEEEKDGVSEKGGVGEKDGVEKKPSSRRRHYESWQFKGPDASAGPSESPSAGPSDVPSESPSVGPADVPSESPSDSPSDVPSESPSVGPSESPSDVPSDSLSDVPSEAPSAGPSESP